MALQCSGRRMLPSLLMLSSLCCTFLISNAKATETVIYSQGFESNNGSFTHTGTLDTWEWGTPSPTFTPGPMAAHAGSKCWGTDLDDSVRAGSNAYLTSPEITLPAIGADSVMRVRFFAWIAVDMMFDRGEFQVSKDGASFETKAELFCTMQGGWQEYDFDISDYADTTIYLRFRCYAYEEGDESDFNPPAIPFNMAGLYIDDVAITVTDAPTIKKTLIFEGSEYQSDYASCPWVYVEGKKGGYEQENDIYSTAKGSSREYIDYYQLNRDLSAKDGKFIFKLKETDQEESFTDLLHLIVADHSASVDMACDENGNAFTYKKSQIDHPSTAVDNHGNNVLSMIEDADEFGCKAYNGDYIEFTFDWNNPKSLIFLLRAKGFMVDTMPGTPIAVQPKIEVQTQNASGVWTTRNIFYPRWESALAGYNLAGLFPYAKKIRLLSSSCFTGKYHNIDWAAIFTKKSQESITKTELLPESAIRSDGINVAPALSTADGNYAHMSSREEMTLTYNEPSKSKDNKRDYIIKSKGYYNPMGTYFFYTWDGSKWAQRDGWSIPAVGDQTRQFDLSLWLPDPAGENKIRIWQDFIQYPAEIDYVGLRRDSVDCFMNYAIDLRTGDTMGIRNLLNLADDKHLSWGWGVGSPNRDRWVEVRWVDTFVNTPPSTNPVFVTGTGSPAPTINWTYFDIDGNTQNQYEIEVWTGPNGTGSILWDPAVFTGMVQSKIYEGSPLTAGQQYYARVKAYDSLNWGGWSEAAFIVSSTNHSPVADAGHDTTVTAAPSCETSVSLDGSASYDVDGDTLSFQWTGSFGLAEGVKPSVFLYPGSYQVKLIVSDGKGGSGMDSVTIVVHDTTTPIPDSTSLQPVTGECIVNIATPPTATDNCAGLVVGTTDSLNFTTPGTHVITWHYTDGPAPGYGNTSTQLQTIVVTDNTAPVPDSLTLPELSGDCRVDVTNTPTATDNCFNQQVVGTTTDPLSYLQKGTYTITWSYQDANGNVATQPQTVTVTDLLAPVPDSASLPELSASCEITVNQFPTATDNCMGTIVGTTIDPLNYTSTGTYTITWHYDDGNGNVATQTQSVVIADNIAPIPDLAQLPDIQADCWVFVCTKPTATDNCKGQIIATTTDPLFYTIKGTYSITWTYDDSSGNIATQTQNVIVADNSAPVPTIAQLPNIQGNCWVYVSSRPMAFDNCKGFITGTTIDPLWYSQKGTYTINWTYNDGNGNISSQPQTVVVVDNTAPVPNVNPLPAITGYIRCGKCYTVRCYPTAMDNCKGTIIGTTSSPLTYCYRGNFIIVWKYNDGNGNITTQNQTVYIR